MSNKPVKPLCEVIAKDIPSRIFPFGEIQQAEKYAIEHLTLLPSRNYIFLDLHGVTDILNHEQLRQLKALNTTIVVVSYVGHTTDTRVLARQEIQRLVNQEIVQLGALVFSRKFSSKPKPGRIHRRCLIDGSKYWFINNLVEHIKTIENEIKKEYLDIELQLRINSRNRMSKGPEEDVILQETLKTRRKELVKQISEDIPLRYTFFDDSEDHVYALEEIEGMESHLFEGTGEELIGKLTDWVKEVV